MPPGRYTVTASKPGFSTIVQENMELTVGQALSLPISMRVSGITEEVTVSAEPIEVTRVESSVTLNELTVSNTPVLGRKFEDLLTLTPGVSIVQGPDGDEINFAGQRGIFNNISLDGGDYNNGFFGEQVGGQRAAVDISMEAVREFQVVATGASTEFGRTAGGVVNVVTKSGTNDIHGSLFPYQRLEGLTSNTSDGKPLQDFRREQSGGSIGGPIVRRSEEHTSELQSRLHLVCRLLLEKKKKKEVRKIIRQKETHTNGMTADLYCHSNLDERRERDHNETPIDDNTSDRITESADPALCH